MENLPASEKRLKRSEAFSPPHDSLNAQNFGKSAKEKEKLEMAFKEDYRSLLKKRLETDDEIITYDEPFIKDTIRLFAQNIEEAIEFLKNDCTSEEYIWISELIDLIAAESKSHRLIQTYAELADKYPQETRDYHIRSFIQSAMSIADSGQADENRYFKRRLK